MEKLANKDRKQWLRPKLNSYFKWKTHRIDMYCLSMEIIHILSVRGYSMIECATISNELS